MRIFICICLLVSTLNAGAAGHNPILPQPQKIKYGNGNFNLKGVSVGFASRPTTEDKFAAGELARILSEITSENIRVAESGTAGASIILDRTGNPDPLPVPDEKSGPGSREAYRIKVTPSAVKVTAKSSAGLFYAVQTLIQMIEGSGKAAVIPEAEIDDWPVLAYRAFMMDMSHFQLPKIEEIMNQIDFLAKYKGNQYLFYSEASIELDGYPLLMAEARFTKDQVREIIEYGKQRHVDVVPNLELYGHTHDLFRLERYSDMSVVPHGGEFIPDDPRVKPLLDDWITQISRLFPSPFFHIGFDETWSLEFEAKKRNKTPEELYLHMLTQVTDIVEREGKRAMVWADMLQKYPSIIPKASRKMYAVPWHYSALTDERYETLLSPFQKENIPMIVQGAIKNWNWVAPNFVTSFENTDVLIKAGKKYGAVGFIQSGWTDDPLTLMRMGFPDIAYGCIASWQTDPVDRQNFFNVYAKTQYPPALAETFAKGLNALYLGESLISKAVGATDPAMWANPLTPAKQKMIESNKDNLHNGRIAVQDARIYFMEALKAGKDPATFTAFLAGAKMLDFIGLKYLYAGEIGNFWKHLSENPNRADFTLLLSREIRAKYHSRISDMLDITLETKDIFLKAWNNEYEQYRIGWAVGRFDAEFQFWMRFWRALEQITYKEGEKLPPLESLVIY